MPNQTDEDRVLVQKFAANLTSAEDSSSFCFLTGEHENIEGLAVYDIPSKKFKECNSDDFEKEETRLIALNQFWNDVKYRHLAIFSLIGKCLVGEVSLLIITRRVMAARSVPERFLSPKALMRSFWRWHQAGTPAWRPGC